MTHFNQSADPLAKLEAQAVNLNRGFVAQMMPEERVEVPRIVVVGDDKAQVAWLGSMLEQAGYRVDVFHELAAFSAANLISEPPAAVIMDMMFPEGPRGLRAWHVVHWE